MAMYDSSNPVQFAEKESDASPHSDSDLQQMTAMDDSNLPTRLPAKEISPKNRMMTLWKRNIQRLSNLL
jgi:hypothetical protein